MKSLVLSILMLVVLLATAASADILKQEGVKAWGVDPATKVLRDALPPSPSAVVLLEGAKGEIVSGQAAIRSDADLKGVHCRVDCIEGSPLNKIRLQWVRYLPVKRNSFGVPQDELIAKAPVELPDPFWEQSTIDIEKDKTQTVWIDAAVPRNTPAGSYEATLVFEWAAGKVSVPLRIRVWDFELPAERHQQVTNWFDFPSSAFKVAEFSPGYWELLAKFAKIMVEHRQTCFRTYLSLIRTSYDKRRGYVCNFDNFDRWVKTFFDAGMDRIELFQVGAVTTEVLDRDATIQPADLAVEVKNKTIKLTAEQKLRGVLRALEKHLKEKGWQKRAMMHVNDEPFIHLLPSYKYVANIARKEAPSLKLIEAIETTGFGSALDVLVPKLNHMNLWWPYFQQAKKEGKEVWFYTCCHPLGRYPNRFIDQPLVETRLLHWISYLYGLDGYLHWGANWYAPGYDPTSEEGVSEGLTLGDRAILYPGKDGPLGCIRWSAMRDGLQDFEYLRLLEVRLFSIKKKLGVKAEWLDPRQRPLEICRRVAWSFYDFTRSGQVLLDARRSIAEEIEAASKPGFFYVQTEPMEGTSLPYGLRLINVRGLAEPGAMIRIDGEQVAQADKDGCFAAYFFVSRPVTTFEAEKDGKKQTLTRKFVLVD